MGRFSEQGAECDDGSEVGEVEEEEGGDGLGVQAVCEVGDIVLLLPLDVVDKSTKDPTRPNEARLLPAPPVIVNDVFFRLLKLLLLVRLAARRLYVGLGIPVAGQRLDAVDELVQGRDDLILALGEVG